MESVDDLRRALEAARAETAALRAAAERADRAPRGNDTGDAGEAVVPIEKPTMMDTLGRERTGMLELTRDKVRAQQIFSGVVKIDRSLNFPKMKMKPRCGICVLGPTWMVWVWGTRWTTRSLLSL